MDLGPLAAVLLAVGGLVATGAAVLITIRNARTKGRRSAIGEADDLVAEVAACRAARVEDARRIFELEARLAEHGLDP